MTNKPKTNNSNSIAEVSVVSSPEPLSVFVFLVLSLLRCPLWSVRWANTHTHNRFFNANENRATGGRRWRRRKEEEDNLGNPPSETSANFQRKILNFIFIYLFFTGSMIGFPLALQLDSHALRGWSIRTRIPSLDTWATSTSVPIGNDPVGAEERSLFFFQKELIILFFKILRCFHSLSLSLSNYPHNDPTKKKRGSWMIAALD